MDATNYERPPGLNSPYGPYVSPPTGNEANHGFAPNTGISTSNPTVDIFLNMIAKGIMGDTPMLRSMTRPKVSDYAYTAMQERERVSSIAAPAMAAANPINQQFGEIAKSPWFQQFVDSNMSPGGSMNDAFNVALGRFGKDISGPGMRNAEEGAVMAGNIVKNIDSQMLDENGMFDYGKSSGFNRRETVQNLAAYNKKFGGFGVNRTSEQDQTAEIGEIAKNVMTRPSLPEGPTIERGEEIDKARKDLSLLTGVAKKYSEFSTIKPSKEAETEIEEKTKEIKRLESVKNEDVVTHDAGDGQPSVTPKTEKDKETQSIEKNNEAIQKLTSEISKVKSSGISTQQTQEVQAAQSELTQIVQEFGKPEDVKTLKEVKAKTTGGLGVLAEQETPENSERMQAARAQTQDINKMVRESQNLFGADKGIDELMDSVGDLIEGSSDMTPGKVTDLVQKIQATAAVVDMSNEAINKYFKVVGQMYKGMGIRGNTTSMAQNALIAAEASTQERRSKLKPGEMDTGPSTEEEALANAERQARVATSAKNTNIGAALIALSDKGTEGEVKSRIKQKLDSGDIEGAEQELETARSNGQVSESTSRSIANLGLGLYEKGYSKEQLKQLKKDLTSEQYDTLLGANTSGTTQSYREEYAESMLDANEPLAQKANEIMGDGGADKIKSAIQSGELNREVIGDKGKLTQKLKEMSPGMSDEQAADLASKFMTQEGLLEAQGIEAEELRAGLKTPEEIEKEREVQEEISVAKNDVNEASKRSPYLRDLNFGEEAMTVTASALNKLEDSGVDVKSASLEQLVKAAGGALGDWAGMDEKQKKALATRVEAMTGRDDLGGSTADIADIEKQGDEDAERAVQEAKKATEEAGGTLSTDREKEIREKAKNQYVKDHLDKIKEELGTDGAPKTGDGESGGEKNGFDPEGPVAKIIEILERIENAINKTTEPIKGDTNPNPVTEQNQSTWDGMGGPL